MVTCKRAHTGVAIALVAVTQWSVVAQAACYQAEAADGTVLGTLQFFVRQNGILTQKEPAQTSFTLIGKENLGTGDAVETFAEVGSIVVAEGVGAVLFAADSGLSCSSTQASARPDEWTCPSIPVTLTKLDPASDPAIADQCNAFSLPPTTAPSTSSSLVGRIPAPR
jgi:hypothetical protein